MSWNALSVTAIVEFAGPRRSGAALGLQQTMLQVSVVAAPLAFAPFVAATSWQAGFAVAAAVPARGRARLAATPPLRKNRSMERVLVLAGDAVEDLEIYYILYRLREAGYAVDVAALSRRTMRTVVHDFEPDSDAYVERPGRRLEPDLAFSEVDPEQYVGVVIPGGRAPEYIRVDPDVKRIVAHFFDNDLPVGTLCHGPQVPAALGYLQGRKSSGFPPLAPDIEAAGGTYVEGADVVDGNMVSCTGWPDLAEWSKAFVALLERAAVPV